MDLRHGLMTFVLIFLAELGDKTQLTTMTLAAQSRSPFMVFVAAVAALSLSAGLGVLLGEVVTRYVPAAQIQLGAGLLYILIGLLLVFGRL